MIVSSPDIAASLAAQAKEIAAAAELYVRMPNLRKSLMASLMQQMGGLDEAWEKFFARWEEENGPEKRTP